MEFEKNTELNNIKDVFDYTYDHWNELGYASLRDAIMAESNRLIAVQLAKLNDKIDPLAAYMMGFMEWTRENNKEDN